MSPFGIPIYTTMNKDLLPIPDGLIVLVFDDAVKSHVTFVGPLLKSYGFNATFYITEGLGFLKNKERYMTWEEVRELHDAGFEIGNHTGQHKAVSKQSGEELLADIEQIDRRCEEYGIPVPVTFCYPGGHHCPEAVAVLEKRKFLFAKRSWEMEPSWSDDVDGNGGLGSAYDPTLHPSLLVPTTGMSGPNWPFEDFVRAVEKARDGKITVFTFHGVPDLDHHFVNTEPETFKTYMEYLHEHNCTVIAVRDLTKYVDPLNRV